MKERASALWDLLRKLRYSVRSIRVLPNRLVLLQNPFCMLVFAQSLHQTGVALPIWVLLVQKHVKLFPRLHHRGLR